MRNSYIAIDLGASSGRVVLINWEENKIELEIIRRFENKILHIGKHSYWNIYSLYDNIIEGLKSIAEKKDINVKSIGVDSWGVDFAMLGKDGDLLRQPYSYRDNQTKDASGIFFKRISKMRVYGLTGIEVMNINSLYQLDTLRRNSDSAFQNASKFLFIPDAINYLLSGELTAEYTIASTSQLINAHSKDFDKELLSSIGLKKDNFGEMVMPGTQIGILQKEIQKITGLGDIPIVAVAGHDTASAIAAIPTNNENVAFLSSGTWSLMGVEMNKPIINEETEKANFTNEGGVNNKICFLKNICGMWLLERSREEWAENALDYSSLIEEASTLNDNHWIINPDHPDFNNPENMVEAIQNYCKEVYNSYPEKQAEVARCIFDSLAKKYKNVLEEIKRLTAKEIEALHIFGGGSKNKFLNQCIANELKIPVIAGPSEATSLGNAMIQIVASNKDITIEDLRLEIKNNIETEIYYPNNK